MSEEEKPKSSVCENFEPQAWRKTVCRNCFQPPDSHVAGSGQNGVRATSGSDRRGGSVDKTEKSAASSLKNKYEQLEKDKHKPKDPPHTLPRTKKSGSLSLITGKYDQLDSIAGNLGSPTKSIPPPTPPKTYKKGMSKDGTGLMKSKFGSMENVSSDVDTGDNKLGLKFKFGSMENISLGQEKKKDPVPLPAQKSKFGGSVEHISIGVHSKSVDSQSKDKRHDLINKLDMFQSELKSGATSKSGQTVIHQQRDGNVDIISIPTKKKESDDKETKPNYQKKDTVGKLNDTIENKSKFEKPELKSASNDAKDMGPSKFGIKSKFELKSPTPDKEKQPDFKLAKVTLSSSKVNASKSVDNKFGSETKSGEKDTKTDLKKPGFKSVQKDNEENKLSSFKDKLNKTEVKLPNSKLEQDTKLKALNDKNREESGKSEPKGQDSSKSDDIKKPKNFKDQLKSPEPETSPLSKFKDKLKSSEPETSPLSKLKDKLKSPTAEPDSKQASSWKDKLKSPTAETEKKPELKINLKSSTSDIEKEPELKLKNILKSPIPEESKRPEFKLKAQLKSPTPETEKKPDFKVKDKLKSPTAEKDNVPDFKLKDKLKSPTTDQEKKSNSTFKTKDEVKTLSPEKSVSNDLKSKFDKTGLKSSKPEDTDSSKTKNKPLDFRIGLKKSNDISSKDKEPPKMDSKNKYELPSLKSNKPNSVNDKNQGTKATTGSKDLKGSDKLTNKFEPKFKLNKTDSKSAVNDEKDKTGSKTKFELPKLKSSKSDQAEDPKSSLKSKFEPKSKLIETKTEPKNKFEIPSLKKVKSPEPEKNEDKISERLNKKDSKTLKDEDETVLGKTFKALSEKDHTDKTTADTKPSTKDTEDDFQKNKDTDESRILESKEDNDLKNNAPQASDISKTHFDTVSSDTEAVSGDACAGESTRDKSPLHVDTQVFTSSRSKTAGVSCLDDNQFDSADNASGFSSLDFRKSKSTSPSKDKIANKETLVNGDIASEHDEETPVEKETLDNEQPTRVKYNDSDIEKLKAELLNMTERCQNLETENEMLRGDLNKKGVAENSIKNQRDEVENAIKGLRGQLKSLQDKCTNFESENINLMNDLKAKHESNQNKSQSKETEEMDERLTSKEKIMEDLLEENEQLKQEINELKVEMEEMYDSFRDQEAEEFREIQKELEYTAKNCRILQFKLRKMERRNEQTEQDKNQYEDRLRKLQNSFKDRDAVSHIHSLEDELRMAKEVSVRLHDELDLMEDRRSKVEEENRHITELLEQADRKQFRLELEVDKLRDKVVELRTELRAREGGPEGEEPRN